MAPTKKETQNKIKCGRGVHRVWGEWADLPSRAELPLMKWTRPRLPLISRLGGDFPANKCHWRAGAVAPGMHPASTRSGKAAAEPGCLGHAEASPAGPDPPETLEESRKDICSHQPPILLPLGPNLRATIPGKVPLFTGASKVPGKGLVL